MQPQLAVHLARPFRRAAGGGPARLDLSLAGARAHEKQLTGGQSEPRDAD